MQKRLSIEDFSLLKVLGKGTYGKVLLVRKRGTDELYALKILQKEKIKKKKQIIHTRTERIVLEKVQHPFIVKLHSAFQNQKKLYLVLEYVPGGEVFFHLQKFRTFKESRAKFYAACLVLALEYLHSNQIVYRDLKPENVLIGYDGYPKITDFGLAKQNISDNCSAKSVCGTPEYLAPEVLFGLGHGMAVDWWSLGILIYEMLTGMPPFYGQKRDVLFSRIKYNEVRYPAHISENCKDLISQLLIKDPHLRLGSDWGGAEDIKQHPWFEDTDFEILYSKQYSPPFVPVFDDNEELPYVDNEFSVEPAIDSPIGKQDPSSPNETFKGFSFEDEDVPVQYGEDWDVQEILE